MEVKQWGEDGSDGPDNSNGYLGQLSRFMEMDRNNEQRESKAAAHSPATTNTHMHNIN